MDNTSFINILNCETQSSWIRVEGYFRILICFNVLTLNFVWLGAKLLDRIPLNPGCIKNVTLNFGN